ncbi:MAG: DUF134 domain-containing protein [Evtepia sp.]|uniref:DUF134 domain-containing protein n=1 Tax=Evtepia sp. TaxID=2773933 RepID=UPI002A75679B|nr:DUF134 domain-containing protein [Evtepia sp.]MDY3014077.1 DUF134 domain-containing protein [Evtepia sp.]
MPRPQRCRRVCKEPDCVGFSPEGKRNAETVLLSVDEFEVLRLVDHEKMTHGQCAEQMDISRTTVTEIYESARYKVSDALVNGNRLLIAGGTYRLCDGSAVRCCGKVCEKAMAYAGGTDHILKRKEGAIMRIAVTYDNGEIFQHFGRTEQFKVYDAENGKVVGQQVVDTMGSGHGALAGFLLGNQVDVLICGGAQAALSQAGIQLYGGVKGSADQAVQALLGGNLQYNAEVRCDHHGHHHGEGHQCGDHGCGSHGCHEH